MQSKNSDQGKKHITSMTDPVASYLEDTALREAVAESKAHPENSYPRPERKPREKQKPKPSAKVHDLRLHMTIADNDLKTKLGQADKFLLKQDQVRVTIQLRGRERGRPASGMALMGKVIEALAEHGTPNQPPKHNEAGGQITVMIRSTYKPQKA
jgi:hypothetical protein